MTDSSPARPGRPEDFDFLYAVPWLAHTRAGAPPAGGRCSMLCFSERQPGDWGPRRVTQNEIRASFDDGWRVDSIQPARFDVTIDPNGQLQLPSHQGGVDLVDVGMQGDGAHAWLAAINRT